MPATSYSPGAKQTIIRSYVRDFYVGYGAGAVISRSGNIIHVHYVAGAYFQDTYIILKEEFADWSSNCYTLDWIIEDEYTDIMGAPTHVHSNYALSCGMAGQSGLAYVFLDYAGGAPGYVVELERGPSNYWYQLPTWSDISPL